MKQKITLFFSLIFVNFFGQAQTTLSAGDIAIIGYNYDASPQEMTIVTLVPISSGTVIRITDYGYDQLTSAFGSTSSSNTSVEGSIAWTVTSAITAGTVIKFSIATGTTPVVTGLPGTVSITGWTSLTTTSSPSPAGGDNWFIFQGSSPTSIDRFVFAWANPFSTLFFGTDQPRGKFNVAPTPYAEPNLQNSYLPSTLTLGTSAIALNRNPSDATSPGYHGDNNVYIGTLSGSKSTLLSSICTISNWNTNETTTYNITPGGSSFPGTNPIFTVITPNSAPTDISLSATTINENVIANSTVGTMSSTDPDAANTFTYTLVSGTGDTDNASFNISDSSLRITASPDFETKSSYSVRVRTTDQGELTFEKQFTITIDDLVEGVLLNTSPTLTFTSNPAAITNDDIASDGEGGSQTISDIDIQIYNISNSSGTIQPELSWQSNSFMGSASSSYSGLTNENNAGSKGMAIKSADGSEFKLNQFIYYNWGETESLTNTVKGYRNGSEVASTTFEGYNSAYNPITITLPSSFENVDEVRFYITAGGYMGNQSATNHSINSISVSAPVANSAPTDITLSALAINENVAANSTVGTLSSNDLDAANTFTYTLVSGTGDTDNASFNISGSSLKITASPDFETKSSYSVRVRTTDQGGLFFEKAFTITINDLCDLSNLVTLTSGFLTATQTGATYQWYNCSNNSPVGTNSNTYTPSDIQDYKVDITLGSCTVTSACMSVNTLGAVNFKTNDELLIYPNPSQGIINVKSDSDGDFQVVNQMGQVLKTFKAEANQSETIDLQNLNDAIYFIKEVKYSNLLSKNSLTDFKTRTA